MKSQNILKTIAILLLCALPCLAQVPVALAPTAHQQFLDFNGHPLSGGKVFFFAAGTSTPQATYVDIGGVIQNANPIILDSGGFATIYLAAISYKICVQDLNSVPQWCQDNVNAFQIVLGAQTIILAGTTSDPSGAPGQIGYRSDLGCVRFFNSAWDCLVGANQLITLTNKTLTAPVINGNVTGTGNYVSPTITTPVINGASTGTGISGTGAKLMTAGTVVGVGATLCTDVNLAASTSACPSSSGFKVEGVNVTPVTVGNTVALTPLQAVTIPANDIGVGQTFYLDASGIIGDTASPTFFVGLYLDGVLLSGGSWAPVMAPANTQPWGIRVWFTGITTGVGGTVSGAIGLWQSTSSGGALATNTIGAGSPPQTVVIDTTVSHLLELKIQWGTANALNTLSSNVTTVYRVN
jgi:hypothetical protein